MKQHTLFFMTGLLLASVTAADPVQESFNYGERMTFDQGCGLAEEALKQHAVAQQCGSRMTGGSMRMLGETADVLYRLHFETTGGRVTTYKRINRSAGEGFSCVVTAELTVQCDQGKRDPAFLPAVDRVVKLNETVFRHGENLLIALAMPGDLTGQAHLNVALLSPHAPPEARVAKIYPNQNEEHHPLRAGEQRRIPGNKSYDMMLGLAEGQKSAEEALMFIFSRKPISLPPTMSIEQLHGILAEIPLDERRELVVAYRIESGSRR